MRRILILVAAVVVVAANVARAEGVKLEKDDGLTSMVAKTIKDACDQFKDQKLEEKDVAVTVIDLKDADHPRTGSFRGDAGVYPASVVKLFYLTATHRALEDGKLNDSDELRRAMHDMIVDSTNDATNWILEAVTDAGNGPLLSDEEWAKWVEKRNSINRYFASMGYTGINTCQKTFIEGPYGRDKLFLGPDAKNRNKLTTEATARLLTEIALHKIVTPQRCDQMLELLHRDMSTKNKGPDDQAHGFSAMVLPSEAKLWSKAGWTSTARHDAAYFELPDGTKATVVVFTTGHANQRQILPAIVKRIIAGLQPGGGK
jgi:beta-lactamase class A